MRICYDHQAFSMYSRGGIAKYFAQLACLIPNANFEVVLPFQFSLNKHYFELGGQQLSRFPDLRGSRRVCNFLNSPSQKRSDFDLVHATYYDESVFKYFESKAFVTTIHDMVPEIVGGMQPIAGKEMHAKLADLIIAVSHNTKRDIVDIYGTDPSKIAVIYHGIDLAEVDNLEVLLLPNYYLLHVGNRHGYKNFDHLLAAFAKLADIIPDIYLVCVGGGDFTKSEKTAFQNEWSKRVIFVNASDRQVRYAMRNAAALICPSLYEGFGIPLIEAMSQGCPLVIADASCFPEIAQDAASYFGPTSVASIVDATHKVLVDKDYRRLLSDRGKLLAEQYSLSAMIEQTTQAYLQFA